jgi:hypothetical protein
MPDIFAFSSYIDTLTLEDYKEFSIGFWTTITSIPLVFVLLNRLIDYFSKHTKFIDYINDTLDNTILPIINTISKTNSDRLQVNQQLYYNGADISSPRLHLYDVSEYV